MLLVIPKDSKCMLRFEHWRVDYRVEGIGLGWRAVTHASINFCGKGLMRFVLQVSMDCIFWKKKKKKLTCKECEVWKYDPLSFQRQYSLTSLVRHPWYYDTFLQDPTFEFKTPSFIRLRHPKIRHLECMFCHIKEVINVKKNHLFYVHLKYIHFHLGTTWEFHLSLG